MSPFIHATISAVAGFVVFYTFLLWIGYVTCIKQKLTISDIAFIQIMLTTLLSFISIAWLIYG